MRFLFVDKILSTDESRVIRGVKHVTADDYYLTFDEDRQIVFMPSLIGETLGQLAAWHVMKELDFKLRPVAGVVSSATSHRSVPIGSTLQLESVIESCDESAVQYHSVATVGNDVVFSIEGALGPMQPMSDFIDRDVVIQQYAEIAPKGDDHPDNDLVSAKDTCYDFLNPTVTPIAFQYDHVVAFQPNESIQAIKKITVSAPYFADHFPLKPVLPLTVLLESNINLARTFLAHSQFMKSYRFEKMNKIKMSAFVQPGEVVNTHLTVKSCDNESMILAIRSDVAGKRVCVLEMILTARG
ncbi:hydroxymyristoyl-ACP dehydratase [Legionella sp. W05-934-2]|jgi:3-hydroxymyristoyl/3-hydroxydecanoyl-(acyl carrier protein) dehydratase|uniref:hydroxymyristoyl-ACP dehydratase n=1 Tax=Legionella sp. W05-934-2 TaxID=1198649 RepID=UPI003461E148